MDQTPTTKEITQKITDHPRTKPFPQEPNLTQCWNKCMIMAITVRGEKDCYKLSMVICEPWYVTRKEPNVCWPMLNSLPEETEREKSIGSITNHEPQLDLIPSCYIDSELLYCQCSKALLRSS